MQKLRLLFFPLALLLWYSGLFREIDIKLAYFFNDWIRYSPFIQNITALLNSKTGDWIYDLIIVLFIIPYVISGGKEKWMKRLITSFLLLGFAVFCYFLWNRFFFRTCLDLKCQSPSKALPDLFSLSSAIDWIKIKQRASSSYPSGHGSTIFMFIVGTYYTMGRKVGLLATFISIPFILPRLLVGAHWTSDFLLGSLPLALFNLEWFSYLILRRLYALKLIGEKLQKTLRPNKAGSPS